MDVAACRSHPGGWLFCLWERFGCLLNILMYQLIWRFIMTFKHECGGNAHSVGMAVVGWNKCVCGRCGEVFYKWFTAKMIQSNSQ